MDLVRGAAVCLVVLLHVVVLSEQRGGVGMPVWTDDVSDAVAPFRIPVLVLLSGMLLQRSLDKGARPFFEGKLRHIAWPFLVWTTVYTAVTWRPADVLGFLAGATYLWYLLFLLFFYVAAWVLRPLPDAVVVAVAFLGALAAPDGSKYAERLLYLFALFLLGYLLMRRPEVWAWVRGSRTALLAGLALLGGQLLVLGLPQGYGPQTVLTTLAGVVLGAQAASRAAGWSALRPLRAVGAGSVVLYVVHYPVILVTVSLATRAGVGDAATLVALSTVTAFASAAVLLRLRDVVPVRWLFVSPWGGRGARSPQTGARDR